MIAAFVASSLKCRQVLFGLGASGFSSSGLPSKREQAASVKNKNNAISFLSIGERLTEVFRDVLGAGG